jgi:type IV secretion system protein VirD4
LYGKTYSLLKEQDYNIIVINLRDPSLSNAWNPLLLPYRLYWSGQRDRAIEMVNDLAVGITRFNDSIIEPYWTNSATDLLMGLILILFECAEENEIHFKSLRYLQAQALCRVSENELYIQENFLNHLDKSSFIYSCFSGTIEAPEETRRCIVSVMNQSLRLIYSQENLLAMLSKSDFDFKSFGVKKTGLFLIMQDENRTYHRLVSIFIKQCYEQLIMEAQNRKSMKFPIRINFLLDEFASLPAIPDFSSMIAASRSRNIRFNLLIQGLQQLQTNYGDDTETIKGNCNNWIFLTSRELFLLREISELAGIKNEDESLISISVLQRLNKDMGEALIFHGRDYPFISRLMDIDSYPDVSKNAKVVYPVNKAKIGFVFNFMKFCNSHQKEYFYQLFSGKKPEDDSKFIEPDDLIIDPIFIRQKSSK